MSAKTDTEVIIGGKVFTLSGYESEEYLQKVASYINNKINSHSHRKAFNEAMPHYNCEKYREQDLLSFRLQYPMTISPTQFRGKQQSTNSMLY